MLKKINRHNEDFKNSIITLMRQKIKTKSQIVREYGVAYGTLTRWERLYSEVKLDDDSVINAQQIKELQKRNAILEEEVIILKKTIAILTPRCDKD